MSPLYYITITILFSNCVLSLENGLARTPPMGWLSCNAFDGQLDCQQYPDTCLHEKQITAITDIMVDQGYLDAGYQYVNIDDCWMTNARDSEGRLIANPDRFPSGIKWLADYVHNRTMKFGIYEDEGVYTCSGFPGSMGYEYIDAQTFADWGVDYLKLDGCYANADQLDAGYPVFGQALNATNRPIVFSCEWAWWADYPTIASTCNLDRNMDDIEANWPSLLKTIDYYDQNQDLFIPYSGPGAWQDPDQLIIGQPGITVDQSKLQLAIWSIWSAPLLISTDLRKLGDEFKQILLNKAVIAIDQDPLGIMGRFIGMNGTISVYVKPVTPVDQSTNDHSYAVAFMNRDTENKVTYSSSLENLGLTHEKGYKVEDLYENQPIRNMYPKDIFQTTVNPMGVTMIKATVIV